MERLIRIALCRAKENLAKYLKERGFIVVKFDPRLYQVTKSNILYFRPQIIIFPSSQVKLYLALKKSKLEFIPIFLTSLDKNNPQVQEIIAAGVPEEFVFNHDMNNQAIAQAIVKIAARKI